MLLPISFRSAALALRAEHFEFHSVAYQDDDCKDLGYRRSDCLDAR